MPGTKNKTHTRNNSVLQSIQDSRNTLHTIIRLCQRRYDFPSTLDVYQGKIRARQFFVFCKPLIPVPRSFVETVLSADPYRGYGHTLVEILGCGQGFLTTSIPHVAQTCPVSCASSKRISNIKSLQHLESKSQIRVFV